MRTSFLLALLLIFARLAFAADFSKGDMVALTRDEPLYFKDSVYRQGSKGETFTVHSHNVATHKIFVVTKDDKGQPLGLNINEEALAVKQPLLPLIEPSEENGSYSEALTEAANQTGISAKGVKQIANFLEKGGMSFHETVSALKQLDYMLGKASGGSAEAESKIRGFDVGWEDVRDQKTYKIFALIAKHVAVTEDEDTELLRLSGLFTRSSARQLLKAIRSAK